ncbi:uncharacterized protein LOC126838409 [Adelges cooleyi]|uniref:uncharacterized protein LOC126838409 n=1 Tax=Adelges cooleyi TaxID=133065 RepID=UPI00217FCB87|nr:uncharacterized protein LOC126838409 [Adelges cooleyi]
MVRLSSKTVLVVVTVAFLACSAQGHPAPQDGAQVDDVTTLSPPPKGIKGWIANLKTKIHEHGKNCGHSGGVVGWVKNKLGFKATTTISPSVGQGNQPETYDTSNPIIQPEGNIQQPDVNVQPDLGYQPDIVNQPEISYPPDVNNPAQGENDGSVPDMVNGGLAPTTADDFDLTRPVQENNQYDYAQQENTASSTFPDAEATGEGVIDQRTKFSR